jgi:hypothetical protein
MVMPSIKILHNGTSMLTSNIVVLFFVILSVTLMGCNDDWQEARTVEADSEARSHSFYAAVIDSISGQQGEKFLELGEAVVDGDGNVYATDRLNFKIIKMDVNGSVVASAGARGKGPGEFERPPHFIDLKEDLILVAEAGGFRISFFDLDLEYTGSIAFREALADAKFVGSEMMVAYSQTDGSPVIYSLTGDRHCVVERQGAKRGISEMTYFDVSEDYVTAVYPFKNKVYTFDFDCNLLGHFSIKNLPEHAPQRNFEVENGGQRISMRVPSKALLADVAVRNDYSFVLSKQFTEDNNQIIYVRNNKNLSISSFELPHGSRFIAFGREDTLYASARRGQTLVRYKILPRSTQSSSSNPPHEDTNEAQRTEEAGSLYSGESYGDSLSVIGLNTSDAWAPTLASLQHAPELRDGGLAIVFDTGDLGCSLCSQHLFALADTLKARGVPATDVVLGLRPSSFLRTSQAMTTWAWRAGLPYRVLALPPAPEASGFGEAHGDAAGAPVVSTVLRLDATGRVTEAAALDAGWAAWARVLAPRAAS